MSLRHERRRRLLADEGDALADSAVRLAPRGESAAAASTPSYTDAGRLACGRPVAALVPTRLLAITFTALASLALVGLCSALDALAAVLAARWPAVDVTALRLGHRGAVDGWLASTLLVGSGAVALFVFSLRRHRLDDYHGRYRVWLWAAAVCLLMSLIETTHVGRLARDLCELVAAGIGVGAALLWSASLATAAGLIALRLLFEVRRCPAAVTGLVTAALVFVGTAVAYHGFPFEPAAGQPHWPRGAWLCGYVLVLATLLLYARYVQLDVSGRLAGPKRERRAGKDRRSEAADEDAVEESRPAAPLRLRTDLDPVEKSPAAKQPAPAARPSAPAAPLAQHLSRAERKRLRRESRMAS